MNTEDNLRAEVAALRGQVENAQSALQGFVYAVAHDLGAPLRGITGFSDIIKKKYAPVLDGQALTYLDIISKSGEKAQNMLNGLLRYSRVYTQGKKPEWISLGTLAHKACDDLQDKIVELNASVVIHDLPWAMCDAGQITELFCILIDNALVFRTPALSPVIHIKGKETEAGAEILVEDNGIGVPQKASHSVFMIFKKLNSESHSQGLGVGLAVASRIVERHKGAISVAAKEGGGAVFSFFLSKEGPSFLEPEG